MIHCIYIVSQKKLQIYFCYNFVKFPPILVSTNFGNFWQKDGKAAKIMQVSLNFHLI